MLPAAKGWIRLNPDPNYREALKHLDQFSHLWLVFVFHENIEQGWHPLITPPRLDSPGKVGVFASRSPHRPNPIGLSAVKLEKVNFDAEGGIEIEVSGVDLLDETPILDIKPYLPYVDQIPEAQGGWTESEIPKYPVHFAAEADAQLKEAAVRNKKWVRNGSLPELLTEILELDPRPLSQKKLHPIDSKESENLPFAFRFLDFDVRWRIQNSGIFVDELRLI